MSKGKIHKKLRIERLPLYADLGKYFSPRGYLNEKEFRHSMRKALVSLKTQQGDKDDSLEKSEKWLSSYLGEVIGYLEEKGLTQSVVRLFQIAVEESSRMGIPSITLPSSHLQFILSGVSLSQAPQARDKRSTEEKRQKIFDAALTLFAKQGFHDTTVDEIADLSGVGKGTVYRNFKSKEDILEQLLKAKSMEIVEKVSSVFSKENDVLGQIEEAIRLWMHFIEDNYVLYRLIQNEAIAQRSSNRAMFYDDMITHLPMIKERIVALNREKKLKTTDFYTVFYGILGFIDGVVHKWFRSGMKYPLEDEVPIVLEVLFNGFVGEKATSKQFFVPPDAQIKDSTPEKVVAE